MTDITLKEAMLRKVDEVLNRKLPALTETLSRLNAKLDRKFDEMLSSRREAEMDRKFTEMIAMMKSFAKSRDEGRSVLSAHNTFPPQHPLTVISNTVTDDKAETVVHNAISNELASVGLYSKCQLLDSPVQGATKQGQAEVYEIAQPWTENDQLKSIRDDMKFKSTIVEDESLRKELHPRAATLEIEKPPDDVTNEFEVLNIDGRTDKGSNGASPHFGSLHVPYHEDGGAQVVWKSMSYGPLSGGVFTTVDGKIPRLPLKVMEQTPGILRITFSIDKSTQCLTQIRAPLHPKFENEKSDQQLPPKKPPDEVFTMDLLRKCMDPVDRCLKDAKMDKDSVLVRRFTRDLEVQQTLYDGGGGPLNVFFSPYLDPILPKTKEITKAGVCENKDASLVSVFSRPDDVDEVKPEVNGTAACSENVDLSDVVLSTHYKAREVKPEVIFQRIPINISSGLSSYMDRDATVMQLVFTLVNIWDTSCTQGVRQNALEEEKRYDTVNFGVDLNELKVIKGLEVPNTNFFINSKFGWMSSVFVGCGLVKWFWNNVRVTDAEKMFDEIHVMNEVSIMLDDRGEGKLWVEVPEVVKVKKPPDDAKNCMVSGLFCTVSRHHVLPMGEKSAATGIGSDPKVIAARVLLLGKGLAKRCAIPWVYLMGQKRENVTIASCTLKIFKGEGNMMIVTLLDMERAFKVLRLGFVSMVGQLGTGGPFIIMRHVNAEPLGRGTNIIFLFKGEKLEYWEGMMVKDLWTEEITVKPIRVNEVYEDDEKLLEAFLPTDHGQQQTLADVIATHLLPSIQMNGLLLCASVTTFIESWRVSKFKGCVNIMVLEAEQYFSKWGASSEVNLKHKLEHLIILTATRWLLWQEVCDNLFYDVAALFHDLANWMLPISVIVPSPPIPTHCRRDQARKKLSDIFARITQESQLFGKLVDHLLRRFIESEYKDGHITIESEVCLADSFWCYCYGCKTNLEDKVLSEGKVLLQDFTHAPHVPKVPTGFTCNLITNSPNKLSTRSWKILEEGSRKE